MSGIKNLIEISVPEMKKKFPGTYLDDDLMIIDEVGSITMPPEPRRTKCLLVAVCLGGSASYTIGVKEQKVEKNDVLIITNDQVISSIRTSSDISGMGVFISVRLFQEIVKDITEMSQLFIFSQMHPVFRLEPKEVNKLVGYIKMLKEKVQDTEHHFRRNLVCSLASTTIIDLSNAIYRIQNQEITRRTRADIIFSNFLTLLEQNFRTERRVGWYAQKLNLSPKYFSECIKSVSKQSPNAWIDDYVCLEIRVLLKNTQNTIKEIANDLHFPNQSFLGKYFKEHVGMSPSEYRNM